MNFVTWRFGRWLPVCKYCLLLNRGLFNPVDLSRCFSLFFPHPLYLSTLLLLLLDFDIIPALSLLPFSSHLSASGSPRTWYYSMTVECSRFYAKTNLVLWQVSPIPRPQYKHWSSLGKKKTTHWHKQLCALNSDPQLGRDFESIFFLAHRCTGLQLGGRGPWSTYLKTVTTWFN